MTMTVIPDFGEWTCVGRSCWRVGSAGSAAVSRGIELVATALPGHVATGRWARYWIQLDEPAPPPSDVTLTPISDDMIRHFKRHPDRDANQLQSAFRFWEHGLRRAYVWWTSEGPQCLQWLLTADDAPLLRTLPDWAGMYPPTPPRWGRVENLFTFSTTRHRGAATKFEYALYYEARNRGLDGLVTHIHEDNAPARGWADRTGWRPGGTITRYQLDLPGLREMTVCVHRRGSTPRVLGSPRAGSYPAPAGT